MSPGLRVLVAIVVAFLARPVPAAVTARAWFEPPRVAVGKSADLSVEVRGTQSSGMPSVPAPHGVTVRYVGPATQLSIVNGRSTASVTHHFTVTPTRDGPVTLGPITVQADGQTLQVGSATLQVAAGAAADTGSGPAGDQLQLELSIPRTTVYLHERVPFTVTLRVGQVRVSNVQFPQVGGDGFTAEPLGQPAQRQETRDGGTYQVVEFRSALTPARAGTVTVGPVTMNMTMASERGGSRGHPFFFGGMAQEPVELASQPVALDVLPLPEQGKPADFSGAVGRFALGVRAAPLDPAAGDPVTLTYSLSGQGDLSSVSPPALAGSDALRVYPVQPATVPPGTPSGTRLFEQVVIPQHPGPQRLPPVRFSWFDPEARAYRSAEHAPITLAVRPAPQGSTPQIVGGTAPNAVRPAEALGRDIVFIKDSPGTLAPRGAARWRSPLFWALQLVPVLLLVAATLMARRRDRLGTDTRYARFTRAGRAARGALAEARAALGREDAGAFHDRVACAVRDYLTAKLDLPPGAITPEQVSLRLREAGLADGVADEVRAFFSSCEVARFAPATGGDGDQHRTLERAEEIVRALERARGLDRAATAAVVLLAVLGSVVARAEETPQALFFRGNALYADGRYAEAAAAYERVLAGGVASAAVHFNLGNAHLKAGDMGRAVLAYERARRLAPGDPDLRANLGFAREQAGAGDPASWWTRIVFPLARSYSSDRLLGWAAVAWWALALLLIVRLLVPAARRAAGRTAVLAAVTLVVIATSAAYRLGTVDLRHTGVVVAPAEVPVRFEPSDSGTVHFQAKPGATLRLLGEREGWTQVGRDDGRRGWVQASAVEAL